MFSVQAFYCGFADHEIVGAQDFVGIGRIRNLRGAGDFEVEITDYLQQFVSVS